MARFDSDTLKCVRKQELIGKDEIKVTVNGVTILERKMEKDQLVRCDYLLTFGEGEQVAVEVLERDGTKYKAIGPVQHISSGEAGTGQQTRDFTTSGTHYELSYEVTA